MGTNSKENVGLWSIPMLDRSIGECMGTNNRHQSLSKEHTRGYPNCNTSLILIFGGTFTDRKSLCTYVIV
jgi:hypothetical protein